MFVSKVVCLYVASKGSRKESSRNNVKGGEKKGS